MTDRKQFKEKLDNDSARAMETLREIQNSLRHRRDTRFVVFGESRLMMDVMILGLKHLSRNIVPLYVLHGADRAAILEQLNSLKPDVIMADKSMLTGWEINYPAEVRFCFEPTEPERQQALGRVKIR